MKGLPERRWHHGKKQSAAFGTKMHQAGLHAWVSHNFTDKSSQDRMIQLEIKKSPFRRGDGGGMQSTILLHLTLLQITDQIQWVQWGKEIVISKFKFFLFFYSNRTDHISFIFKLSVIIFYSLLSDLRQIWVRLHNLSSNFINCLFNLCASKYLKPQHFVLLSSFIFHAPFCFRGFFPTSRNKHQGAADPRIVWRGRLGPLVNLWPHWSVEDGGGSFSKDLPGSLNKVQRPALRKGLIKKITSRVWPLKYFVPASFFFSFFYTFMRHMLELPSLLTMGVSSRLTSVSPTHRFLVWGPSQHY